MGGEESKPAGHADARRVTDHLRLLSELAREFAEATDDYDRLLALIARRLAEAFGDLCVLRLVSDDGRVLESGTAMHHPDPEMLALARAALLHEPQAVGEGITGRIVVTGEPVLIPVVDQAALLAGLAPERRPSVERPNFTSLVAVPLVTRGEVVGVVSLTRSDATRPHSEDDLRLLQDVAAHAVLAIGNARAYASERVALAAALHANEALHESEEAHRLLFEASPQALFVFDVETFAPLAVNAAALRLYGYTQEEFRALDVRILGASDPAGARERLAAMGEREARSESRARRKDGSLLDVVYTSSALMFAHRRARITTVEDMTARREADEARALLAAIVGSSNDAIVSKTLDGTITSWNRAAERLFGYTAEEALGQSVNMLVPKDLLHEQEALRDRIVLGERIEGYETTRLRKDGSEVVVSLSIGPILDAAGKVVGASKTARDLSEQRKAEDELRRLEDQLRQAQKMEAIGSLAGGVAHDFNNLLSVILSNSEMILEERGPEEPLHDEVDEIRKAALRAAALTRQLLVFSRRQVVETKVLDLNDLLRHMWKMLRRILGEDVEVVLSPGARVGRVRADPGSVEQVIMNLVVNARDAMPTGGRLTITTEDVDLDDDYARHHLDATPGPYVALTVTDTGVGMDRATVARIFEPFFTTKGPGRGTGLGLSTVFGIAQQCGGSISVESEPGKGSTFRVCFPRIEAEVDVPLPAPGPVLGGAETILLVEDQDQVRAVAHAILKRSGYRLFVAQNGAEALLFAETHEGPIDLLLTDVVMPQMSGAELAKRILAMRPEAKVLWMSGYTDDSVVRHGVFASTVAFLHKPFTPESLTRKVREVLDAPARARALA